MTKLLLNRQATIDFTIMHTVKSNPMSTKALAESCLLCRRKFVQTMKLFTNWPITRSIHMNINQSKKKMKIK